MEPLFARALYDNTAETVDELPFRKGDIIVVLEKNVAGILGWWRCALHGRQGLAPANRLAPLSPAEAEKLCMNLGTESNLCHQNIYQIPKATRPAVIPIYEEMSTIYKVPPQAASSQDKHTAQEDLEGTRSHEALTARGATEIYDVPSLPSTVMSNTDFHNTYEVLQSVRCMTATKEKVNALPSMTSQDLNYDIPAAPISEGIQKCGYSTMPKPCKSEWLYDVPVFPQKQGCEPCESNYVTMPPKTMNSNMLLYNTLPNHSLPENRHSPIQPLYDIPKPTKAVVQSCTDTGNATNSYIYDVPPCLKQTESPVVLLRKQKPPETDSKKTHESLQYSAKPGPMFDRCPLGGRTMSRQPVEETIRRDDEDNKDHQRSSTVSTSSTASSSSRSSCDSFMLSSPEPEPLREVTLSQEEASNRLLELQEAVCQSVPKLMLFVSSHWRTKKHLSQHLHQIHMATENVTDSVTCFLNFALDVKGNAQRLTDSNLRTRLLKQLSIVEDSGLILQQATKTLRDLGWLLDKLAQDDSQSQTPDHLERFVMVARTIPEDVKRLVSILNANGKLLFRVPAKEPEVVENIGPSKRRSHSKSEPMVDSGIDESDYVQLQTKTEFDQQPKPAKSSFKSKKNGDTLKKQVSKPQSINPCSPLPTSISDHCRLYFGAIQKAISVFLSSLNDGQPPETFISHSKLVIMVGQRLVNTLCNEAKNQEASRDMLSMSNQLCAHLKQLAIVTKKAALNFPDKLALQEVQDIAKELAQRAQHFRMSLDI
ncbi:cas scaffolding protein family member 4 [Carassius gibelio]|uniref:cas scaffolding protein family member 4 n=1 Tax=Carassius gibelio TaxID=101364 RepID=UPI002277D30C|nr:cas scaffolding protein family member 4 [Carassius gibelio]